MIFIDLEKAYDSVPVAKVFEILRQDTLNKVYIASIFNLYKHSACIIINGRQTSRKVKICKGLKQGCSLSSSCLTCTYKKPCETGTESVQKWASE